MTTFFKMVASAKLNVFLVAFVATVVVPGSSTLLHPAGQHFNFIYYALTIIYALTIRFFDIIIFIHIGKVIC
jgi:hypothetical protein